MKNYDNDDTFLGRWIAGELSEEELINFKKTKTYRQFELIDKESQLLSGPDIDVETALQKVKQKLKSQKSKTVRLWRTVSVAAILIIALGIFTNSSKTYSNGIGETQTIVLEDGSEINLNANSSISLKRFFWSSNKTVNLITGEAYFIINKGDGFKVETNKGTVAVLGTKFNIKDRSNFELKCYEGKVEFYQKGTSAVPKTLTKGMQINISEKHIENLNFNEDFPSWKKGFSKFDKQPFHLVLEELTQYFNITFDSKNIDTNRLYSGSFNHKDLDIALKTTLTPMGITYKLEQNKYILTTN